MTIVDHVLFYDSVAGLCVTVSLFAMLIAMVECLIMAFIGDKKLLLWLILVTLALSIAIRQFAVDYRLRAVEFRLDKASQSAIDNDE